jgi:ubiquinone/menaquinone biosynthesis C-methylase UbiE
MRERWTGVFAALYDPLMSLADRAGLREERAAVVGDVAGRVLEVGAGTGLNLALYPSGLERLVLSEPHEPMARRIEARTAGRAGEVEVEVVRSGAEALPFGDGSFDEVVSTLVLCTVDDVTSTLAEIRRVLVPGGRLRFVEHVRSDDPRLAAWQDRVERPWRAFADGCRCNRDTLAAIRATPGLELGAVREGVFPVLPPVVRPLRRGVAVAV